MMRHVDGLDIPPSAQYANDVHLPSDAAERKRVLNILAQRRHRRRKKERLASAEQLLARADCPRPRSSASEARATSTELHYGPSNGLPVPSPFETEFDFGSRSWLSDSTRSPILTNERTTTTIAEFLQHEAVEDTTFADDYTLSTPDLDLLRATLDIGRRLNQADRLFNLTAESIFQSGDSFGWMVTLPENLKPTPAQLLLPHPPLLDILPWPQVRTKLILLYNQPAEMWPRHPADGSSLTVVRLVYDMEEGGVRVRGPEPWSDDAWEIEQAFFETWWFALDQKLVKSTNMKRIARGQSILEMPPVGSAVQK